MSSSSSSFSALHMIETKRFNRRPHTTNELEWWIRTYCEGDIPDYQMSAWLMAVCWHGMTKEETATLTRCMVQSGNVVDWKNSSSSRVDKHSTGGVGDKISLILAPLVVASGGGTIHVPMMAGRGLAHTGGTLDKLESIPGFSVGQSTPDFQRLVDTVGCAIVSATPDMAKADQKIYALRDVTGTVSSLPLITASIVSKKIAEAPDSLVLDVKYGKAAFRETLPDATQLAQSMIATAEANGVAPTSAFLTRMDHPIGVAIGNWLEVQECIDILKTGKGASDLIQLVVVQAAQMVLQSKNNNKNDTSTTWSFQQCVDLVHETLLSGKAFDKFREMVVAQGGDASVLDNPALYPHEAEHSTTLHAPVDGYICHVEALVLGQTSVLLGAGRQVANAPVDPVAGLWCHARVGDQVHKGDPVVTLYTNQPPDVLQRAAHNVQEAIEYSSTPPPTIPPVISHRITSANGVEEFTIPVRLLD